MPKPDFYPRSPCGERPENPVIRVDKIPFLSTLSLRRATSALAPKENTTQFLSTLSLRRATHYDNYNLHCVEISIHALLAESDKRKSQADATRAISIHALLAESDARLDSRQQPAGISIHALLAESDPGKVNVVEPGLAFLSTLSLRRATQCRL